MERPTELAGPIATIVAVALVSNLFSDVVVPHFQLALISTAIVVSIHIFTGNSGVISFGNISFVAVGAFAAGLMTLGAEQKQSVFPELFGVIGDHEIGNVASLVLAAAIGLVYAAVVGAALMRLNGLAAGIATFAVLGVTHNVIRNWTKIGPAAKTVPGVPETTGTFQAAAGLIIVVVVAFAYQRSRFGRRLRASREDPAASQAIAIRTFRERLTAFAISGAMGGFAGGLYVHYLGSLTVEQVYLELTFLTLAMLVIGGLGSLWGAVLGGLVISGFASLMSEAEKGIGLFGWDITAPASSRDIVLGGLMVLVLLARPRGISHGNEFRLGPVRPAPAE